MWLIQIVMMAWNGMEIIWLRCWCTIRKMDFLSILGVLFAYRSACNPLLFIVCMQCSICVIIIFNNILENLTMCENGSKVECIYKPNLIRNICVHKENLCNFVVGVNMHAYKYIDRNLNILFYVNDHKIQAVLM